MTDVVERLLAGTGGGKHWMELHEEAAGEIEKLRDLAKRALPMADALDATKTAVVWTGDMQMCATMLARDIRAALRA